MKPDRALGHHAAESQIIIIVTFEKFETTELPGYKNYVDLM